MLRSVFVCEDSLEGIFTGIFYAWPRRHEQYRDKLVIGAGGTMELLSEYKEITADQKKALQVQKMILKHMGRDNYETIFYAAMSCDERKADAILGTVIAAAGHNNGRQIMNHLSNDAVRTVFELSRKTGNEAHRYKQFIRFRELKSGILFADIEPKSNVLPLIMDHFENRFPLENWAIYDQTRDQVLIHERSRECVLVSGEQLSQQEIRMYSEEEKYLEELFRQFVKSISITERENRKLQQQFLPLWFRHHMTEFDDMA